MKSECSVVDCSQSVVARGLCSRHWKRWSHYGDPTESRSRTLEDAHGPSGVAREGRDSGAAVAPEGGPLRRAGAPD